MYEARAGRCLAGAPGMGAVLAAVLVSCGAPTTPTVTPAGPTVANDLPCGVETIADLQPFEEPRCQPNQGCYPGPARRAIGSCTVAASPAFDYQKGHKRLMVYEDGRPILSSNSPPYPRIVVFDARLAMQGGVRVGMTGADLEKVVPSYTKLECGPEEIDWSGHLRCILRETSGPECDSADADGIIVVFEPGDRRAAVPTLAGKNARAFVRARVIVAIDTGPGCLEGLAPSGA